MGHRLGRVLISADEILARVQELGQEISRDCQGKDPLFIGVLKGAVIFLSDLIRAVDVPIGCDFIGLSSYGASSRSTGVVKITADLSQNIEGRHVVVVEDIIDSGRTIAYLKRNLMTRQPASLRICTLLDKVERREVEMELDYIGFSIPDEFVVGYGLDYIGLYRNLPYLAAVELSEDRVNG